MSQRIENGRQARAFISAGDPHADPPLIWEQLGCSWDAIEELAKNTCEAIPGEHRLTPGYVILCMEMGARLALRICDDEI